MGIDVFGFHWDVLASGFRWVQSKAYVHKGRIHPIHDPGEDARWVLTDSPEPGQRCEVRRYFPLTSDSGLFRTFAQVQTDDRNAILSFANEYGCLGVGMGFEVTSELVPPVRWIVHGETWRVWKTEIAFLRRALHIWDMVEARDADGLARHFRWSDAEYDEDGRTVLRPEGWNYVSHPELPPAAGSPGQRRQAVESVLDLFKPGDVLMPAAFFVQRLINGRLKGRVTPHLVYDFHSGKRVIQITPDSLLAAMWLQFARAIDGNRTHRACKECGKWFEISAEEDGRTARRMFCSDACKSRDYRRRKDRARLLKSEGKPIKDIANELGTDVQTIRKWTSKRG